MKPELPTKGMAKISTTSNPYLTGAPTRWPTPEQCQKDATAVLPEIKMEALKANNHVEKN